MTLYFYVISSHRKFFNRKNSGVREEVCDVNKSMCKNILFVSLRLCTSPLVCAPTQLTLFTSPTTPSTPRHMRGRQFLTLEIWQSPDKFTGKRRIQIYFYFYIYIRSLFRSALLGWRHPPSRTNSSILKKTRIPVGQPVQIRSRDRPRWRYPFEGGSYCCRPSQWWPGGVK